MKKRIGIIGDGQLGRMLIQAAKPLGFEVLVLGSDPDGPAGQVADKHIEASIKDGNAIIEFAKQVDFLTFEVELADAEALHHPDVEPKLNPPGSTLAIIKDKLKQKNHLQQKDIPVAPFIEVSSHEDILKAAQQFNYPLVLKARFDAYDGRGNATIENESQIDAALERLDGRELYVEQYIPFTAELAVIVGRGINGDHVTYPVVQTTHKDHICHTVIMPAPFSDEIQQRAQKIAQDVLATLDGAGVFAIEMFLTKDNDVLVNEIAPRVHNSGHLTIEACETSQFEQHIRAITGMELGSTKMKTSAAAMMNILGDRQGPAQTHEQDNLDDVFIHIYGKVETRPQRKMGHITALGDNTKEALEHAQSVREHINI